MTVASNWIALDWGTSRLRAWKMSPEGNVLDRASSDRGMSSLSPEQFEPALLELIESWLHPDHKVRVLACGMIGAKQGWTEVPYIQTPCHPCADWKLALVKDKRIELRIASGLKQLEPADVMRGEETQVAGLLLAEPEFQGLVCLPGTHSKWVQVASGQIQSFQTFMTGELFGLLSEKSILRHTLSDDELDHDSFLKSVQQALESPDSLVSQLFSLRAKVLLDVGAARTGRSRLSGWLIGQELALAQKQWDCSNITLIGSGHLADAYQLAFQVIDVRAKQMNAEELTLAGLQSLLRNQSDF